MGQNCDRNFYRWLIAHGEIACCWRSANDTNLRAVLWVPAKSTGGATPASRASFHRDAHRHHLSPGFKPGKLEPGTGVLRSLPWDLVYVKNSAVISAQITWVPRSWGPVTHTPVRKNPVMGEVQQVWSSVPSTFWSLLVLIVQNWLSIYINHHPRSSQFPIDRQF